MRRPIRMLAAALIGGGVAMAGDEPLLPPLAPPLVPTSSFGEYRSGHYHGGLDFSTAGREGLPVLASRVGWVFRVRESGVGYGRSLYYRMDDGRTVVYAHLSRFHPRIEKPIVVEQDRRDRYEVDLRPEPGVLAFAAGDTLGYTGQSGAGPAHLHAEVRTGEEASVAVNPWLCGWAPADTVPPTLARLRVEPAQPGVLVNDNVEPVVIALGPGTTAEPLRITGPIRLWVEAWDAASSGSKLAPYRVTAGVDGRKVAEIAFDAVDWTWAREVGWTFLAAEARARDERWIALDPPPGGRLHLARGTPRWAEDLDPGRHTLAIEGQDAAGNRTRATCSLMRTKLPAPPAAIGLPVRKSRFTSRGNFLEIQLRGRSPERAHLRAKTPTGDSMELTPVAFRARGGTVLQLGRPDPAMPGLWTFFAGDSLLGRAIWIPGAGGDLSLADLLPWKRGPDSVSADVEGLRLNIPVNAAYGPLWIAVRMEAAATKGENASGLLPVSPSVELSPWAAPLRGDLTAVWAPPAGVPRRGLALMRREDGAWSFVGADSGGAGILGSLGSLETLALVRDRVPPVVRIEGVAPSRHPLLRAAVRDDGVGVTWSDLTMRLDGHPVIAEWDADAGRLLGHLRAPVAPGLHELSVEAVDRVGNVARAQATFTVR